MTDRHADLPERWQARTFMALLILLMLRIAFTGFSPLNLYADEAQYWRWGETLEWGYYSKPPMIAWVIHTFTSLLGHSEWAIRLPAALLHTIGAVIIFYLARAMYGPRTGFFASLGYALMPAVILSSAVISTDGVLMPFWCAALWALWRLRSGEGGWVSAAGLGAAIGLGFLSKYAMLYFPIGIGLAILFDRQTRDTLFSLKGLTALAIAAMIFAPHLAWNAANEFKTVSHTVDNANLGGDLINPENALTFLVDQLGVFGPISFLALVFGIFVMRSEDDGIMGRDRWLLCFILPVLVIILAQAVLSRANANWAATAYPAASVLVAAWLTRARPHRNLWYWIAGLSFLAFLFAPDMSLLARGLTGSVVALAILGFGHIVRHSPSGLLWTSLTLHGVLLISFMTIALLPASTSTALGFDNALKRTRGWETGAQQIFERASEIGASSVLVDDREAWHGLDYYARARTTPLISWRRYGAPKSYSENTPLEGELAERVLIASIHPGMRPRLRSDFESFESIGVVSIPLGQRSNGCPIVRRFQLYVGTGYTPQDRTPEWENQFEGQTEFPPEPCPAPQD